MFASSVRVLRRRLLLSALLCLVIGAASTANAQYVVEVGQTAVMGVPTGIGYVNVAIDPTFTGDEGYLNVVSGPVRATNTDSWLIQNFPIPMAAGAGFFGKDSPILFGGSFEMATHPLGGTVNLWASFTPSPVSIPNLKAMTPNMGLTFNTDDTQDLHTTVPGFAGGAVAPFPQRLPSADLLTAALPGVATRSRADDEAPTLPTGVRGDIPGIKQRPDECAPTATAQSLKWLNNNKKIQLPNQFLDNKKGDQGLIDELKVDMKFAEGAGVQADNFVPGKQMFIDKYKLPLTVEKGGKDNGDGTLDFIKAQIAKGQDVELWLLYNNGTMHIVTVAGTHDEKDDNGTRHFIYIRDSLSPEATDGYELTGKGDKADKLLKDYKHNDASSATTKMMFAVAESPTK